MKDTKVIKFPEKRQSGNKEDAYKNLDKYLEIIMQKNIDISQEKKEKNLVKLKEQPILVKNILNRINQKKNNQFIKSRDKLIILLVINGIKNKMIIDLKFSNIQSLNVPDDLKNSIVDFYNKYNEKKEYIFYTSKGNRINSSIINNIKNKYITNEVKGEI